MLISYVKLDHTLHSINYGNPNYSATCTHIPAGVEH